MRILLLSDSHGDRSGIRLIATRASAAARLDAVLHMGDGASDFIGLTSFFQALNPEIALHGVRGNCDWSASVPEQLVLSLGGARLLLTHGHHLQVKHTLVLLDEEAAAQGCSIALFGHTHEPAMEMRHALLLNPGSAADGRYGLLELNEGKQRVQLLSL